MKDDLTKVSELKELIRNFSKARDWEQFHTPKDLSMAISAEAAELMEHFLWEKAESSNTVGKDAERMAEIRQEVADIVIYCIQFANRTGMDLSSAIEEKMAKNEVRFPVDEVKGRYSDKG